MDLEIKGIRYYTTLHVRVWLRKTVSISSIKTRFLIKLKVIIRTVSFRSDALLLFVIWPACRAGCWRVYRPDAAFQAEGNLLHASQISALALTRKSQAARWERRPQGLWGRALIPPLMTPALALTHSYIFKIQQHMCKFKLHYSCTF